MEPLDAGIQIATGYATNPQWRELQEEVKSLNKKIAAGQRAIIVLILGQLLGLFQLWEFYEVTFLIAYFGVVSLVYIGCLGYIKVNPKIAVTVPLVVMILLHIFWSLVHPAFLLSGILFKVVIGGMLFRARSAADHLDMATFQMEQIENQMKKNSQKRM